MTDQMTTKIEYDLESVELPYLAGLPLRLFVALGESAARLADPQLARQRWDYPFSGAAD